MIQHLPKSLTVAIGALLLFVCATFIIGPIMSAALVMLLSFIPRFFGEPRVAVVIAMLFIMYSGVLKNFMSTQPFTLIFIAIFFYFIIHLIFTSILRKQGDLAKVISNNKWVRYFRWLIFIIILSITLNQVTHAMALFRFSYYYLFFIPSFLFALKVVKKGDAKRFFNALMVFFFVQLALNFSWWLNINPLTNTVPNPLDFSYGSLDSCRYVGFFSLVMLSLFLFQLDKPINRWKAKISIVLILLALIQFYITYTLHMLLVFAIAFVSGVAFIFKVIKRKLFFVFSLIVSLILLLSVFFVLYFSNTTESGTLFDQFSKKQLELRYERLLTGPKGESYRVTFTELHSSSPLSWIIGVGPGMYMSKPAFIYAPPLALQYMGNYYLSIQNAQILARGGVNNVPMFGLGVIFGELGFFGVFFYYTLYIYPAIRVSKLLKSQAYLDPYQLLMAKGFIVFVIFFLLENFLFDWFWVGFFQLVFAIWAAVIWNPDQVNMRSK